jgi:hypothetical protein
MNLTYQQLADQILAAIASGDLRAGAKVAVYQTSNQVKQVESIQTGVGGDCLICTNTWEL